MADSPSELQFEIEKLERKHAENPEGRFFVPLANAYRKMGDVETAEALLRAGVERHPDYLSAHIVLGRCLADRGAVAEAEEEFRFVLSQDPQNLIALRTLGELAVAGSRPGEAADWYRELLAVDPMNEEARQALDALSDAPTSETQTEFRSGAGWWEPAAQEAGAEAEPPEADYEAPAMEGLSASGEPLDEEPGLPRLDEDQPDMGGFQRFEEAPLEPAQAADGQPLQEEDAAAEEFYGWDDLPGLRADQAGAPSGDAAGELAEVDAEAFQEPDAGELPGLRADDLGDEPDEQAPASFTDAGAAEGFEEDVGTPLTATGPAGPLDADLEDDDGGARYTDEGSSEVVTETIAELYARQGLHERAASVYRELIRRRGGDAALERRLAEIERLGREDEEGQDGLAFADDEALATPPVDVEDDPFAATFEAGFTKVVGEEEEEEEDADGQVAPAHIEAEAATGADDAAAVASIAQLLAGLASWRPSMPRAEPIDTGPVSTAPATDTYPEAAAVAEEPWETQPDLAAEGVADLPYLEEAATSAAEDGTGSAEDEPFPWEMPGGASVAEGFDEEETSAAPDAGLDPFFVDDVEPAGMRSEEPLPEAVGPAPAEARPEPASGQRATSGDPSEDEDLESFQAWLRSLKR